DVLRVAHQRRLQQRVRAVALVAGGARLRRGPRRSERARPRGVPDRVARRTSSAALHRGARGEAGEEPHPSRPAPARGLARRRARPPGRPRRGGHRRPPQRRRHGLGGPRRPGGQRVLHPAQRGRGRRDEEPARRL
ncbi:MAG: hypothetical protein AVDCRST_MAG57-2824, partial [uncultured Blastococcus sp.]